MRASDIAFWALMLAAVAVPSAVFVFLESVVAAVSFVTVLLRAFCAALALVLAVAIFLKSERSFLPVF